MKYRLDGREKLLAIRVYPETTLAKARKHRDVAREQATRSAREDAATNSFEIVAREWLEKRVNSKPQTDTHRYWLDGGIDSARAQRP